MMYRLREGPRFEYREQESQRVKDSPSLSNKFPQLKSLAVDLSYYNSQGVAKNSQIKYLPNLDKAKSVFRFDCLNKECICGDFDLSELLAQAVAKRRTTLIGEMRCQGWRNKDSIETVCCGNILRYKLSLAY